MHENQGVFSYVVKRLIDKIIDSIFSKFEINADICSVAIMYYLEIGNYTPKVYESGKRCVEE